MKWDGSNFAALAAIVVMLVAAVVFTERWRAAGKPIREDYSFRSVFEVVGGGILFAAVAAGGIYAWTGSGEHALGLGGIIAGVVLIGSIRGLLTEYQLKRRGAQKLDKR